MDTDERPFAFYVHETASRFRRLIETMLQGGARYADVFFEQTLQNAHHISAGSNSTELRISSPQSQGIQGTGIRAFDHEQHLIEAVPGWYPGKWEDAGKGLVKNFASSSASKMEAIISEEVLWRDALPPDSPDTVSADEKKNVLVSLIESALSYEPALSSINIEYQDVTRRTFLMNTAGQSIARSESRLGIKISLALSGDLKESYATQGFAGGFGQLAFEMPAHFVTNLIDSAKEARKARAIPSGIMPVVFAGGWAGIWLHETAGHLLEADVADHEIYLGKEVGEKGLYIYDDATLSNAQGSFDHDDEGVAGQQTPLVENGRVVNLLTDRFWASRLNQQPTGNGRRQHFGDLSLPRMTNLCLQPGAATVEELIAEVKQGLFVRRAAGGAQHGLGDRFEVRVLEGYFIENGRLTYPVRDVTISGNVLGALAGIRGIGSTTVLDQGMGVCEKAGQVVPVSVRGPAVLIDGLEVVQSSTAD